MPFYQNCDFIWYTEYIHFCQAVAHFRNINCHNTEHVVDLLQTIFLDIVIVIAMVDYFIPFFIVYTHLFSNSWFHISQKRSLILGNGG